MLALEIPHKGGRTFGYRVSDGRSSIAYLSDHGPSALGPGPDGWGPYHDTALALAAGVDLLIHDAQHTAEELPSRVSWGHSAADYPVRLAELAGAKAVLLFHHDPIRTDDEIDAIVATFAGASVPVTAAVEGTTIDLYGRSGRRAAHLAARRGCSAGAAQRGSEPSCQARKARTSARSSICLVAGLPWPWPAADSTRRRIGRSSPQDVAACSRAAILRAWHGSTRLSSSPVVTSVAG